MQSSFACVLRHQSAPKWHLLAAALVMGLLAVAANAHGAPTLRYTTTWVGNTFGGGPKWVQNFNNQMQVLPDGTVYLASFWDEAGREVGIYRNGDVVGQLKDTHMRGGFAVAVGGGYAWYAHTSMREDQPQVKAGEARTDKPICYFGVSRFTMGGDPAPFPGGMTRFRNMLVLREGPDDEAQIPRGLATDGKRLVVSDTPANKVRVFDCATLKEARSVQVDRPTHVALAPNGDIWALSGGHFEAQAFDPHAAPAKIVRISPNGQVHQVSLPLPAGAQPSSLAFDPKGRLFVTDQGPSQQVFVFTLTGRPRLVDTLGVRGGIYSGPRPGSTGPMRFAGLTGASADAKGNYYVSCNVPRGGTLLRAFSPQKKLLWELMNLEFVDVADADPKSDGRVLYTADGKYSFDPAGSPGRDWRWLAQTLDPFRYPDDPRLHMPGLQCGTEVRYLGGRPFLCLRGMWQGVLGIYRIQGDLAVPCVVLAAGPMKAERSSWQPKGQPQSGRFFWRDDNANGQMDPGEYTPTDGPTGEYWASNVDSSGDIWQGGRTDGIWRWRFLGLDDKGIPRYATKPDRFPMPPPFTDLLRTEYVPETDTMYLTGQTKEHEITGGEWGTVGTEVARYDNWSKSPTLRYRTVLPYQKGEISAGSFAVAGNLFLAAIWKTAEVYVYDNRNGALLGTLKPGPEVHGESGWLDFRDAIRAYRRSNGDYLVFAEEDWKGKTLIYKLADPLASDRGGKLQ